MTDTFSLRLLHHVTVVHGGTGDPYPHVNVQLGDPVWPHWRLRRRGADVLLSADAVFAGREPATTLLEVETSEEQLLQRFADGGVGQLVLHKGADADVQLTLAVTPVQLEVVLTRQDGTARTGRTVEARSGVLTVPLPAVGGTNVYRSAPRLWDPALQPYGIFVNGTKRTSCALDYSLPVTRVRVIDP
ncbi:MAG: hypothetical protein ACXVZ4_00420 [Gaiellaceae bacterium]